MKKALFTLGLLIITLLFISNALAHTVEIANGLDYLTSIQNMDGSWDSSITDTLPATTAVIETYQTLGETTRKLSLKIKRVLSSVQMRPLSH